MELSAPSRKYPAETKYQQTEVGLIPADWAVCKVEEAFAICNQLRLPLSRATRSSMSGQYPYYGPTGPQDWINEFRLDGEYALIGEDGDHFLKWKTQPMTLLVQGRFNVNNHAHVVQGAAGNYTDWFRWFFANRDITQFLTRQGASRYKLTKATLACLPCAIPSPNEQRAISGALTDADTLIDSLEQLLTKKRQIKQGAMQELLTGKRRLPGFQSEWHRTTFGEVALIDPENLGSDTRSDFAFNYIALEGVDQGQLVSFVELRFDGAPSRARRVLRRGDVLVSTVRPNLKSHLLFGMDHGDWVGSTGFSVVRCKPRNSSPGFLFALLFSMIVERQIDGLLTGSNYPAINGRDVANLSFSSPPYEEQVAISEVLYDMDSEINAIETRLTKARALKQAMSQALLTGRIRLVESTA